MRVGVFLRRQKLYTHTHKHTHKHTHTKHTHTISNKHTWSDNNVREHYAVKVLQTLLLKTTVVALKVLPLGSYAPMSAPSSPFKTILELVLWNGLSSCRCIIADIINVIKIPSF
jgi:hypothetical protein